MSTKPLKIAILQLTRIGDLIQTTQAVRQFKAENPDTEITLIARNKFASGIMFLLETVFDDILLFDTKEFFSKPGLSSAQGEVHNFINTLNQKKFDVSVNLSFTKSSSYLNSLINCQLRLGTYRNNNSELAINDNWSQYVYSNVMNSANNPFSLVDIFRYILGGNAAHKLDPVEGIERKKQIVLHPFASTKKKKWGYNKWSELIFKVAKDNPEHMIHIVGGPEDEQDADRILNSPALSTYKSRLFSHAGEFDISQTYELLMHSELFIGHDSLVSHIAAETITPTVIISLGTVRPFETTSYQENVVNISPRNKCYPCQVETNCESLPCHGSINHQTVAIIAHAMLNNQIIDQRFLKAELNPFQLDTVRVYTSKYEVTGLHLNEISANYKNISDVFKDYYHIIWQCYLKDTDVNISLPDISYETASQLHKYQDGVNYLYEIYNFGIKFSNRIINEAENERPNIELIQEMVDKLAELDQMTEVTKKSYPYLAGLIDYFYVHKANTPGNNIIDISKSNLITYYDASNLTAVLYEFVEKSVSPHINIQPKNMEA